MTAHKKPRYVRSLATAAVACGALLGLANESQASPYSGYRYYGETTTRHGSHDYDRNRDGYLSNRERLTQYYDTDHDGWLSPRERRAMNRQLAQRRGGYVYADRSPGHLDEHDVNNDGYLDRREMQNLHVHDQLETLFRRYDRNRDGYLTWREVRRSPLRRQFQLADHNNDRYLTWNELEHYIEEPEAHVPQLRFQADWRW